MIEPVERTSLDPVEVSRLLAGYLMNPRLAAVVGPYSLIILLALAGAALSLTNRKSTARLGTAVYLAVNTIVSLAFTVPLATLTATYNDSWEAQTFFLPLAFGLAYMGDRWKDLFNAALEGAKAWIRNWANKGVEK